MCSPVHIPCSVYPLVKVVSQFGLSATTPSNLRWLFIAPPMLDLMRRWRGLNHCVTVCVRASACVCFLLWVCFYPGVHVDVVPSSRTELLQYIDLGCRAKRWNNGLCCCVARYAHGWECLVSRGGGEERGGGQAREKLSPRACKQKLNKPLYAQEESSVVRKVPQQKCSVHRDLAVKYHFNARGITM